MRNAKLTPKQNLPIMPLIKAADRPLFMDALSKAYPIPKSELNFTTPYELLVAVMLSAQATDKGVNLATAKLFPVANTPRQIVDLGVEGIIPYIKTINLFPTKAKHIVEASRILLEEHCGEVPQDFKALVALPGVGRKTANVVLNVAFGMPTIAVDTHIFRVCNRTGFARGKTPTDVEEKLLKIVPEAYLQNAHHWLLLFGRYCCKARNPECGSCPVASFCTSKDKKERLKALEEKKAGTWVIGDRDPAKNPAGKSATKAAEA